MTVLRRKHVHIVSNDGTPQGTKITLDDGSELQATAIELSAYAGGPPWRAEITCFSPTLDLFTDADLKVYTEELDTYRMVLRSVVEAFDRFIAAGGKVEPSLTKICDAALAARDVLDRYDG